LSAMTGRSVELVSRRALKPFIGRRVLHEAIPV
jgi:predicted nucleotidyltransferase